jgi:hypothetical protein
MSSYPDNARWWLVLIAAASAIGCADQEREEARKRITPEYSSSGRLQLLKYDSKGNGQVDTWSYMDGARVVRIEFDRDGDGKIDRTEYYDVNRALVRAEEDADANGTPDKWETYDGARLSSVAFDTLHRGTPDYRLTYSASGAATMDRDLEGDGHLLPEGAVTGAAGPTANDHTAP